jgi:hypothetical protein
MVDDVHSCLYARSYERVFAITGISFCILCFYPHVCMGIDKYESKKILNDLVVDISHRDLDHLIEKFNNLEKSIQAFTDPLDESRQFLQVFIEAINTKFGLKLTVDEAYSLIRRDLHTLELSEEEENMILQIITLFESDSKVPPSSTQNFEAISRSNVVDLNINWLGSFFLDSSKKRHKKHPQNHGQDSYNVFAAPILQLPIADTELPGAVCAGGAEMLAGALICILGTVFPPAYSVGGLLIADGGSRVLTGLGEMEKSNSPGSIPTSSPPSSGPFNVNF